MLDFYTTNFIGLYLVRSKIHFCSARKQFSPNGIHAVTFQRCWSETITRTNLSCYLDLYWTNGCSLRPRTPLDKLKNDSSCCFCIFSPPFFERGWKGASGTICSTIGCNFTRECTFALKLLLFRPQQPYLPPVYLSALLQWRSRVTALQQNKRRDD